MNNEVLTQIQNQVLTTIRSKQNGIKKEAQKELLKIIDNIDELNCTGEKNFTDEEIITLNEAIQKYEKKYTDHFKKECEQVGLSCAKLRSPNFCKNIG